MTLSLANLFEETVEFANYHMDDDAFYAFCQINEHLKLERNPDGTVIGVPSTGGKTGN